MTFQNLPTINSEDTKMHESLNLSWDLSHAFGSHAVGTDWRFIPQGGHWHRTQIRRGPKSLKLMSPGNWLEKFLLLFCFASLCTGISLRALLDLRIVQSNSGKEQSHRTSFMTGHLLWQARLHSLVVMIVQKLSLCEAWLRTGGTWKSKMTISVHSLLWKPLQLMIDWMIRFLFEGQTAYWARAARQTFEALVQTARVWENLMYIRMIRFHINEWCGSEFSFARDRVKGRVKMVIIEAQCRKVKGLDGCCLQTLQAIHSWLSCAVYEKVFFFCFLVGLSQATWADQYRWHKSNWNLGRGSLVRVTSGDEDWMLRWFRSLTTNPRCIMFFYWFW